MVRMCRAAVWLMWSIIAASVVDLPLPVGPVTRTRPRSSSASCLNSGGAFSWSRLRMLVGMVRNTAAAPWLVLKALTRKRADSPNEMAKSISFSASNRLRCSSVMIA